MTFHDWIFSVYPEGDSINGAWGGLHIATLLLGILFCVAVAFIFRNKVERTRRLVIVVIACVVFFFEMARRIINFSRGGDPDLNTVLYRLLLAPGVRSRVGS